ncbi:MAG: S8 family serine peptidase [Mariniphaga sp.]|nr:S8 family serine peptidase [Mariniphaga sp.]
MKRSVFIILALIGVHQSLCAQNFYWVAFTHKGNTSCSFSAPEEFLSVRAIFRRAKQGIPIDSLDIPVNPAYIKQVVELGCSLVHSSRWLNGITVKTTRDDFPLLAQELPFVQEVELTKKASPVKSARLKFSPPGAPLVSAEFDSTVYGASFQQIAQLKVQYLHNQNFDGQGIHLAVLDAGFYQVDKFHAFESLWRNGQIPGTRDFVTSDTDIFEEHYHGMSVLSVLAGKIDGQFRGSAPGASYWLIRTEDDDSEYLIEEDNWIAGAEFADSAGVDIINSSLGYTTFDDPAMNHTYLDMDGNTTRVTRAANIAASRGMLIFVSAGNEGREGNLWKYISAPSDGDDVICVAAVNSAGTRAPFSSHGPASDGDIKPNVSAMGVNTVILTNVGTTGTGNGTSYASPLVAGAAACLWQANPHAHAIQVKQAIEQSANQFAHPDSILGYGIPDMNRADQILKSSLNITRSNQSSWKVYPNPAHHFIILQRRGSATWGNIHLQFYSSEGRMLHQEIHPDAPEIMTYNIRLFPPGIYLLKIISASDTESVKITITR